MLEHKSNKWYEICMEFTKEISNLTKEEAEEIIKFALILHNEHGSRLLTAPPH